MEAGSAGRAAGGRPYNRRSRDDMPVNYIVLAIPVFMALILAEVAFDRAYRRGFYRLDDSITDLSCGIVSQVVELLLQTALFAGYLWLWTYHRLGTVPATAWAWAACFLGVDFFYYWFHRTSHEVNAIWATHVVHHQSEDYNLAVALR